MASTATTGSLRSRCTSPPGLAWPSTGQLLERYPPQFRGADVGREGSALLVAELPMALPASTGHGPCGTGAQPPCQSAAAEIGSISAVWGRDESPTVRVGKACCRISFRSRSWDTSRWRNCPGAVGKREGHRRRARCDNNVNRGPTAGDNLPRKAHGSCSSQGIMCPSYHRRAPEFRVWDLTFNPGPSTSHVYVPCFSSKLPMNDKGWHPQR